VLAESFVQMSLARHPDIQTIRLLEIGFRIPVMIEKPLLTIPVRSNQFKIVVAVGLFLAVMVRVKEIGTAYSTVTAILEQKYWAMATVSGSIQ